MEDIERFLEIVCREVDATDARLELGGRAPSAPELIAHPVRDGFRLVAVFDEAPTDPGAVREKLAEIARAFETTIERVHPPRPTNTHSIAHAALDEALGVLARQADAVAALVIDEGSPIVWGSSEPAPRIENVETAQRIATAVERREDPDPADLEALRGAELDARRIAVLRAIAATRAASRPRSTESDESFGVLARPFAGIYRLVLAFDGPFSTLRAEGALRRALPAIERLVADLPPLDPGPRDRGGRLLTLRPRG